MEKWKHILLLYEQLFSQGFAKEIAARYNRDPYNMLEKIGDFLFSFFTNRSRWRSMINRMKKWTSFKPMSTIAISITSCPCGDRATWILGCEERVWDQPWGAWPGAGNCYDGDGRVTQIVGLPQNLNRPKKISAWSVTLLCIGTGLALRKKTGFALSLVKN